MDFGPDVNLNSEDTQLFPGKRSHSRVNVDMLIVNHIRWIWCLNVRPFLRMEEVDGRSSWRGRLRVEVPSRPPLSGTQS